MQPRHPEKVSLRRLALPLALLAGLAVLALATPWHASNAQANAQQPPVPVQPPKMGDPYGGTTAHIQKGTGFFTIAKVGNRWTFVTPDGNAFWMRGVQHSRRRLH